MMFLLIVTMTSMLLAAIMSTIAWRLAGDERRRSDARVAALAGEIHGDANVGRILADPPMAPDPPISRVQKDPAYGSIFAGGALVFAAAVALVLVSSGRFAGITRAAAGAAQAAPAVRPLELIALGHERVGDQLTVRGIVRNPEAGAGFHRLTAVVLLFTPDGGFLTSGRAEVDATSLPPGGESTFVVTVPRAAEVGRYRVSFRTDDRVVPHLDRRHES